MQKLNIGDDVIDNWIAQIKQGKSFSAVAAASGVSAWTVKHRVLSKGFKPPVWNQEPLQGWQAAWIAAVIDCEGTMTIHTPMNKYRGNRNIQVYTRVEMTDEQIPLRLQLLCGGSFRGLKAVSNPLAKPRCYWNLASNGLRWLLPQIMPYLIVKQRHAQIITMVLDQNKRGMKNPMPFSELYEKIAELRTLNQRGFQADLSLIRSTTAEDVLCLRRRS